MSSPITSPSSPASASATPEITTPEITTPEITTPETADAFLKQFVCREDVSQITAEERSKIRTALVLLARLADYQTLGICADDFTQAINALEHYLIGLEHALELTIENAPAIQNSIYLKYNTRKQSHHLEEYTGKYRGVLVSFQSDYTDGIFGTYGHFPFDLFESPHPGL